jgi:hypothetical protein
MLPPDRQLATEALDATTTSLEVSTNRIEETRRRIDLVLENAHWVLGVENKPWAPEQKNQLAAYRLQLENRCRNVAIPCHILYLSGACAQPLTDREDLATLVMGYNWNEEVCGSRSKFAHLSDWLDEAEKRCRADRVRHFLNDFSQWVKECFKYQTGVCHSMENYHEYI